MPVLSIVIVNYNTRDQLQRCLESIHQTRQDLDIEVIIVDNGSRDGSSEMVRQQMPEAVLIEPGYNSWFSGGNNIGFAAATGDYIFILNADTILQPDTLQTLLSYLQDHPDVGAVTCPQNGLDGQRLFTCSQVPGYLDLLLTYTPLGFLLFPWRNHRRARMWYTGWLRDSTRSIQIAPGSCIMASAPLIQQIKGFDEALKLYFTEDDLCKRMLDTGCAIHFVADTFLVHEEQASTRQVQRLASRIYFDDLLVFSRKYYGRWAAVFLQVLMIPQRWMMSLVQRLREERSKH